MVGIIAAIIALAGLLAALGHVGYLALLSNAAKKRGASGDEIASYTKGRWPVAGGATGLSLVGLLFTLGDSIPMDVIGILLAVGGGVVGWRGLQQERNRYPTS